MAYKLIVDTTKVASFQLPGLATAWIDRLDMTFDLPIHWSPETCLEHIGNMLTNAEVHPWRNYTAYEQYVDEVKALFATAADEFMDCGGELLLSETSEHGTITVHLQEVE